MSCESAQAHKCIFHVLWEVCHSRRPPSARLVKALGCALSSGVVGSPQSWQGVVDGAAERPYPALLQEELSGMALEDGGQG